MILLHAVLLLSVLLPALSAPDLSKARARVNEIRNLVQENQARLENNAAKITNQIQSARSSRSKRQHYPEYAPPLPPQPPVEYESAQYDDEEPTLVHICPVEDDGYARSAEEHKDFHLHPQPLNRKRKPPMFQTGSEKDAEMFLEDAQMNPRDAYLQEMTDVREILSRFEDDALRNSESDLDQRPNSKYVGNNFGQNSSGNSQNETQTQGSPRGNGDLVQAIRVNSEEQPPEMREAEAVSNPHLHSHVYNHGTFPISTPGLHLAHQSLYRPALAPGLNLNFNQHQSIQPLIHSNLLNTYSVPSVTQPIYNTGVSARTLPVFTSRFSQKDTEAEAQLHHDHSPTFAIHDFPPPSSEAENPFFKHIGRQISHKHKKKLPHNKFEKNNNRIDYHHHHLRDAEENVGQNFEEITWVPLGDNGERILTQEPEMFSSENQHHINLQPNSADELDNDVIPIIVRPREPHKRPGFESNFEQFEANRPSAIDKSKERNSFRPVETNDLREAEEHEADLSPFERVASPKFKNKKQKRIRVIPIYLDQYPTYGSYYDNEYYREADTEPDLQARDGEDAEELEREANPTFKNKKMKKTRYIPVYPQQYPSHGSYYGNGPYREAELRDEEEIDDDIIFDDLISSESREAKGGQRKKHKPKEKPKRKHKGRLKVAEEDVFHNREVEENDNIFDREEQPEPARKKKDEHEFPPRVGAEEEGIEDFTHNREVEENDDIFDSREPEPSRKKKDEHEFPPRVGAEEEGIEDFTHDGEAEENFDFLDSREAEATHKKKNKNKFPHRNAEEFEGRREYDNALDELISSNYLFHFPQRRRYTNEFKRSLAPQLDELLGKHRQVVDSLQRQAQDDEDLKFVADLSNRTLTDVEEKVKKITKRSISLTRLISDPNVRLDVPQTIENFGTATKNAVEDDRAPIYHLRQMIGSSKNAFLSALRIPPQNMIIPSDYEIVKASDFDPGTAEEEEDSNDPFSQTFRRVGQMLRQSVQSGQEAVAHLGDAAHSARNVLHTARHAAPRLILPYSQISAIQNPKNRIPNKAILITPRILDLAEETSHLARTAESKPNFVRFGHLTDAVGISKPHSRNLDLHKIIFEPRRISEVKVGGKMAELYGRFRNDHDDADRVNEALNTLKDAKVSVGAQNLKDLLVKMKHELSDVVRSTPHTKLKIGTKKQQEMKEMGAFIETLFDGNNQPKNYEVPEDTKRERKKDNEEVVGDGLFLPPELMHPFMGRPSQDELKNFLIDNGDEGADVDFEHREKQPLTTTDDSGGLNHLNRSDLGSVLGAINPLMFERLYNDSVRVSNNDLSNPEEMLQKHRESDANDTVGVGLTAFGLTGPLEVPFMGQVRPQQIENFLDTYNQEEPNYIELDE